MRSRQDPFPEGGQKSPGGGPGGGQPGVPGAGAGGSQESDFSIRLSFISFLTLTCEMFDFGTTL